MIADRVPTASQRTRPTPVKLGIAAFIICLFAAAATLGHPVSANSLGCDNGIAVPGQEASLVADCETLLDVKATLDPGDVLDWSVNPPIGNWEGVSISRGRVAKLQLSGKGLSGSVPVELGNLPNLTLLNLRNNELSGSIRVELGNLSNLTELYLDSNNLTGSIPPELGNLANLTLLYLFNNGLTGPIPAELGDLPSLLELYLADNNLTGSIPPELGNLTNLSLRG